ncbi:NAD(P)/FAD-dependent oxidoreductase (plasmid) [Rhizobium sp. TH2]|nr:NAD(P)/FAD-dependent oxidoreductase [Rhizobium sp. TH2]
MVDALVIGGGPAGLTAALYLARFHLSVVLVDAGNSRAAMIPRSHNLPFWPEGISGVDLLRRMREQVVAYPVETIDGLLQDLRPLPAGFEARAEGSSILAKAVILATGVRNRAPSLTERDHADALQRGLLRYCPICDGYEITDKHVAIVGEGDHLYAEAKFLRSYTRSVAICSESGALAVSPTQRQALEAIDIEVIDDRVDQYSPRDGFMELRFGDVTRRFDAVYAAFGPNVRSTLAANVGADVSSEGCVRVDGHQRTSVPGLYAAGDVVLGVDQIGHAIGQAVVAATTLRNDLSDHALLLR